MQRRLLLILLLFPALTFAQDPHSSCREVSMAQAEFLLDSLTVVPGSIVIKNDPGISYSYDPNTGLISFAPPQEGIIEICYQTIPYTLHHTYSNKSLEEYNEQKLYSTNKSKETKILNTREELFPTDNLQKSGSLSRGISFGNAQNVVVNSALNLQLEGKLGDDLNILASITDQNVPFQPEGNTAQIQDFDNIYIELFNDNFSLKAGDVVFRNRESEFLRYYKNVQGGMFSTKYKIGKNSTAETALGISVAKGKFASIQLEVEEGVSGPYRIRIPDASDFVIVMANSEKVFLDGVQLQRGFNYDYVIDYNRAEIQFTSAVLITKFSRVRIDVEYSDQNFSRSIVAASHYQKSGKAGFLFNYYSEKDNPNRPLTVQLDDEDRDLMRDIGDDLDKAIKNSAREAEFNPDAILYALVDTVDQDMNPVQVYKYSQQSELTLFRVSFSEVGHGKGDYLLTNSTANGRIYAWVSPENNVPQGNFTPMVRIPAPTRKDMITLGGDFNLNQYERVFTEVAFTENDINRFSTLDANDNRGFAVKGGFESKDRPVSFMKNYRFSARADYEFDDKYFSAIDRFRYIEFDRDWNYNPVETEDQSSDHILNAGFGLEKNALNRFSYKMVKRKRDVYVDGVQHYLDYNQGIGRFQLVSNAFLLDNIARTFDAQWNRVNVEGYYKTRLFVPGYKITIDENTIRAINTDSITSTAMNYREHLFYINSNDTLKARFGLSHSIREDRSPVAGELERGNTSNTTRFFINSDFSANQKLNFLLTYRNNLNYLVDGKPKSEETIMARADWYAGFFKRHVRSDLTYAIGNGRELKREFVYVPVPTGQGTHTWRDDNGDGTQDLSEFYLAINPDEKNFIKIFVPTSEYLFAYENSFNYRLNFDLPRNWKNEAGLKKLMSRLSGTASWNIIKRITNSDLAARILPFYNDIPAEDILSLKESVRSRIFYNRTNPGFGFDFGYLRLSNKQLLSQGFEGRSRDEFTANTRVNLSRLYSLKLLYQWGNSASNSDFLQGRKYLIDQKKVTPEISWQPGNNFRLSMLYGYSNKINLEGEPMETAHIHEIVSNARVSKAASFSLDAILKYSNIDYSAQANTPVAYEMLEALQPGQNYTWSVILQKKILQGLQLSVNYEGRKSQDLSIIHIGRMQVSALF
jgi:hypothetical protein